MEKAVPGVVSRDMGANSQHSALEQLQQHQRSAHALPTSLPFFFTIASCHQWHYAEAVRWTGLYMSLSMAGYVNHSMPSAGGPL